MAPPNPTPPPDPAPTPTPTPPPDPASDPDRSAQALLASGPPSTETTQRHGAVVLCGGRSSRMGSPKAWLPFAGEPMLARVVRILREVVGPVVVVAAPDQLVPPLPDPVRLVRDPVEGLGPLAGLAVGLQALAGGGRCESAYLSSCDVPLLRPAFVRHLLSLQTAEIDAVVPVAAEYYHPLAAVYRVELAGLATELVAAGQRRPLALLEHARLQGRVCRVPVDHLRSVDPELDSLVNLNTPADYQAALRRVGSTGTAGTAPTRPVGHE